MKEWLRLIRSFRFAWSGIVYTFRTQRNMQIHGWVTFIVLLLSWWLKIPRGDVLLVLFCISLVLSLELVNTAIETVVDLVTSEWQEKAKISKDVAAGAVLMSVVFAVIIGCCVFAKPLWEKITLLM
ncbi:diacylglycerol kinase family protein [Brevibacillus ginsengisoli]|uniref:diacylglycerol kinase family protein n=1 Tax=Brevibacillus ginsengisoli TaxID=363854 RepID=UPI003CE80BB0